MYGCDWNCDCSQSNLTVTTQPPFLSQLSQAKLSMSRILLLSDSTPTKFALFAKIKDKLSPHIEVIDIEYQSVTGQERFNEVLKIIKESPKPVFLIGHGLGATIALSCEVILAAEQGMKQMALYKRVGDQLIANEQRIEQEKKRTNIHGMILFAPHSPNINGCGYISCHYQLYHCEDDEVALIKDQSYLNSLYFSIESFDSTFKKGGHSFEGLHDSLLERVYSLIRSWTIERSV